MQLGDVAGVGVRAEREGASVRCLDVPGLSRSSDLSVDILHCERVSGVQVVPRGGR